MSAPRSLIVLVVTAAVACSDPTATRNLTSQVGQPNQKIVPTTYAVSTLPLLSGGAWSEGTGINDKSMVSGFADFTVPCSPFYHITSAVLWPAGSAPNNIGLHHPQNNPATCFYQSSYALDVNNAGHAAGTMVKGADFYAFYWDGAAMIDIGGGPDSRAYGINATDAVVGYHLPNPITGGQQAFKWTAATGLVDLHPAGWMATRALDINDAGQIVGIGIQTGGSGWVIVRWSATNVFSSTKIRTSAEWSYYLPAAIPAAGINATGVIAAARPSPTFHNWYTLAPHALPAFLPDTPAVATDISALSRVVGYRRTAGIVPILAAATTLGGYTELLPGTRPSWAAAVNKCGSIAGTVAGRAPTSRAALWVRRVCD